MSPLTRESCIYVENISLLLDTVFCSRGNNMLAFLKEDGEKKTFIKEIIYKGYATSVAINSDDVRIIILKHKYMC